MGQTFWENCFEPTHQAQTDLQHMEDNFNTLRSNFFGASQPGSPVPGQTWIGKDISTQFKIRDFTNTLWLGVMTGDSNQKIWIYRNDAMDGWAIDANVTDKVLALKGTGGGVYDVPGGTTAGDWETAPHFHDITDSLHEHIWYYTTGTLPQDYVARDGQGSIFSYIQQTSGLDNWAGVLYNFSSGQGSNNLYMIFSPSGYQTSSDFSSTKTESATGAAEYRPYAAVGTLQYLI